MKQTTTPAIKYIDGQPFVRVIDLGHMWNTSSSNILAIGKRHHVPEEQLRRIDGRVWCSFQGLRYRVAATKHGSSIAGRVREFLDAQAEKTEPKQAQATDNAHRLDAQARAIHNLQAKATTTNSETFAATGKAAQAVSVSHASRNRARNNANRITRQAARLDKLDDRMAAAENDSYRRFDTVMTRCHRIERRQGDTAVQLTGVKQDVRFLKWTAGIFAILHVVGGIIRMARRR